jgi:hypothetical protein
MEIRDFFSLFEIISLEDKEFLFLERREITIIYIWLVFF